MLDEKIGNDPRSLFNGNHFSSVCIELLASERSERDTLRSVQSRIAIYVYSTYVTFAL